MKTQDCIFCQIIEENNPEKVVASGDDYAIIKGMQIRRGHRSK